MSLLSHDPKSLSDRELDERIDRALELAADARRYSGPAGSQMWKDEARRLLNEQQRRKEVQ